MYVQNYCNWATTVNRLRQPNVTFFLIQLVKNTILWCWRPYYELGEALFPVPVLSLVRLLLTSLYCWCPSQRVLRARVEDVPICVHQQNQNSNTLCRLKNDETKDSHKSHRQNYLEHWNLCPLHTRRLNYRKHCSPLRPRLVFYGVYDALRLGQQWWWAQQWLEVPGRMLPTMLRQLGHDGRMLLLGCGGLGRSRLVDWGSWCETVPDFRAKCQACQAPRFCASSLYTCTRSCTDVPDTSCNFYFLECTYMLHTYILHVCMCTYLQLTWL